MYREFIHSAEAMRRTRFATPRGEDSGLSPREALGEALIRLGSRLVSEPVRAARTAGASS